MADFGAFMIWGAGAGLIYLPRKRLLPLVIVHPIANFSVALFRLGFLICE